MAQRLDDDYLPAAFSHLADDYRILLETEAIPEDIEREEGIIRKEISARIDGVDPEFIEYAKQRADKFGKSLENQLFESVMWVAHQRHKSRVRIS